MDERFVKRMSDKKVRHDVGILGDFVQIWCDDNHGDQNRHAVWTDAAELGVYGSKTPVLCDECEEHLAYAEKRRVLCPKDPKPFCAHCDTHCYKPAEAMWQREMMRHAGKKSWRKGHAIDGIRHMLEGMKAKRNAAHH